MTAIYDTKEFLATIQPGDSFYTIATQQSRPAVVYEYTYAGPDKLMNEESNFASYFILVTIDSNHKQYPLPLEHICRPDQGVFTTCEEADAELERRIEAYIDSLGTHSGSAS